MDQGGPELVRPQHGHCIRSSQFSFLLEISQNPFKSSVFWNASGDMIQWECEDVVKVACVRGWAGITQLWQSAPGSIPGLLMEVDGVLFPLEFSALSHLYVALLYFTYGMNMHILCLFLWLHPVFPSALNPQYQLTVRWHSWARSNCYTYGPSKVASGHLLYFQILVLQLFLKWACNCIGIRIVITRFQSKDLVCISTISLIMFDRRTIVGE